MRHSHGLVKPRDRFCRAVSTMSKPVAHKVVALVSGGKDSCFNMVECVRHGHEIVALANLKPVRVTAAAASSGSDGGDSPGGVELDSFCFQSVGSEAIDALAECMDLPLYRRAFRGKAVVTGVQYAPPPPPPAGTAATRDVPAAGGAGEATVGVPDGDVEVDEVEEMYELLAEVKRQHPEVTAVSSGAILSTYQRNRVENVCGRLGLVSLAYMWQRSQPRLMADMLAGGLDAILIKVASIGLTARHVGKSLALLQGVLSRAAQEFQVNVCGEGGEYETLTLDCSLFKRRIVVDTADVIVHSDDAFAPVALMAIKALHTEEKAEVANDSAPAPPAAPLAGSVGAAAERPPRESSTPNVTWAGVAEPTVSPAASAFHEGTGCVGCIVAAEEHLGDGIAIQTASMMQGLAAEVTRRGCELADIVYVHLYLTDLADFATVNLEYCKFFGANPPSRSCVQVASLPGRAKVMADCFVVRGSAAAAAASDPLRSVLHVQSVSHWAPTCIGPYSQANCTHGIAWLAGQIGLAPATMTLVPGGAGPELEQTLRNCSRVLDAVDSDARMAMSTVVYVTTDVMESSEEFVVGSVRRWLSHGSDRGFNEPTVGEAGGDGWEEDDELPQFDRNSTIAARAKDHAEWGAQVVVVGVPRLPRGAAVELEVAALRADALSLRPVAISCEDRQAGGVRVTGSATAVPTGWCAAKVQVLLAGVEGVADAGELSADADATASAAAEAMVELLRAARCRWRQLLHLRIYAAPAAASIPFEALLLSALARFGVADGPELECATTTVAVSSLPNRGLFSIAVTCVDLGRLEAESWIASRDIS